jgi:hypothetical protein
VSPLGVKVTRARVYHLAIRVDGRLCTVLANSTTSKVACWIREVAAGVLLGQVFWESTKRLKFVLVFPGVSATVAAPGDRA